MDFAGQTNGLIILASASLAITQYFHNHLATRFSDAQKRLRDAFEEHAHLITESMRQNYDSLRAKKIRTASIQVGGLFAVLFALGCIKFADLCDAIINNMTQHWLFGTAVALAFTTLAYTVLLAWIAISLGMITRSVRETEREAREFVNQAAILAEAAQKPSRSEY